jgi:hypothetical protein
LLQLSQQILDLTTAVHQYALGRSPAASTGPDTCAHAKS